jgi:hypothetical protein
MSGVNWGNYAEAYKAIATASELYLFLSGIVDKITYEYTGSGASKVLNKKKFWKGGQVILELTYSYDADYDATQKEKTGP